MELPVHNLFSSSNATVGRSSKFFNSVLAFLLNVSDSLIENEGGILGGDG